MTLDEVLERYGPVALVCGEDEYGVRHLVETVRRAFDGAPFPEMNRQRFYGDDEKSLGIIDACQSMPAFAPARLVEWHATAKAQSNRVLAGLTGYFANPNPSTILLLVVPGTPDNRLKVIKHAKKSGFLHVMSPPPEPTVIAWLEAEASAAGASIEPRAAKALVRAIGCDRVHLRHELDKLMLYVAADEPIAEATVTQVVKSVLEEDVWRLADLLAERRLGEAMALVHQLLEEQRSAYQLVPALAYRFRVMGKIVGALANGVPPQGVGRAAGVSPRDARQARRLGSVWTPSHMDRALTAIATAENELKGGSGRSDRATLEQLCASVCG
jgi:DNA polymerase III subunit delta